MSNRLLIAFFVVVIAAILGALFAEQARNPTFRAEDHADLGACLRAIPGEWAPGSIEYMRAENGCRHHFRAAESAR